MSHHSETLSDSDIEVIQAFLSAPSASRWDQIKDLVIAETPHNAVTLQQAVESISFFGWGSAPDPFSVYRALKVWGVLSEFIGIF